MEMALATLGLGSKIERSCAEINPVDLPTHCTPPASDHRASAVSHDLPILPTNLSVTIMQIRCGSEGQRFVHVSSLTAKRITLPPSQDPQEQRKTDQGGLFECWACCLCSS